MDVETLREEGRREGGRERVGYCRSRLLCFRRSEEEIGKRDGG